jgi:hypothetical protein
MPTLVPPLGPFRDPPGLSAVGSTAVTLLRTFENCRIGLPDGTARRGGIGLREFFLHVYEKERPRLREDLAARTPALAADRREPLFASVEDHLREVLIPGYCRLAGPFTVGERNDFYLAPRDWHLVERAAWALTAVAAGALVTSAPFAAGWGREWVLAFLAGGFAYPSLRRYLAARRYAGALGRLATAADDAVVPVEEPPVSAAFGGSGAPTSRGELRGDREVAHGIQADGDETVR